MSLNLYMAMHFQQDVCTWTNHRPATTQLQPSRATSEGMNFKNSMWKYIPTPLLWIHVLCRQTLLLLDGHTYSYHEKPPKSSTQERGNLMNGIMAIRKRCLSK